MTSFYQIACCKSPVTNINTAIEPKKERRRRRRKKKKDNDHDALIVIGYI